MFHIPSSVSSTTGATLTNFISKCFNYNIEYTDYLSIGDDGQDVILDFGSSKLVGQITLWMYWSGSRIFQNLAVYGSNDNVNWTTLRASANWQPGSTDKIGLVIPVSPATAYRYIKFYSEGSDSYDGNEYVEIQVSDSADLAKNETSYSSGDYNTTTYVKEHCNDGLPTTRWASANTTDPDWWSVDLGADYKISSAIVDCETYSADFDIQYSDDNIDWTDAHNMTVSDDVRCGGTWSQATAHRYWRVYSNTNKPSKEYISVWSIEFYGEEAAAPPPPTAGRRFVQLI